MVDVDAADASAISRPAEAFAGLGAATGVSAAVS
jgi:hypothetical protein